MALGFILSLRSDELFGDTSFVGMEHYLQLPRDSRFLHALSNTIIYCGLSLVLILPAALALAHLLRRAPDRLRGPLQFFLLLPGLTPPLVLALLYLLVFNGPHGILNAVMMKPLGLPNADWIRDPRLIKISLAMLQLWRWSGFIALIFQAGLEGVPRAYFDTAKTEGATAWKLFLHVTLPSLKPVTAFVAAFLFLDAFVLFEGAYVLLGNSGGTLDAGLLLVSYSYYTAFTLGNFGSAAAMAFASLPLIMFALWLLLRTAGNTQRGTVFSGKPPRLEAV